MMWLTLTLIIIVIITIASFLIYRLVDDYLTMNKRLATVADMKTTMETGILTINVLNASKIPAIWDVHESKLKTFTDDHCIPATFKKDPNVDGKLVFSYDENLSTRDIGKMIKSVLKNSIYISPDDGKTKFWANSVKDSKAQAIGTKANEQKDVLSKLKFKLLKDIRESDKHFYFSYNEHFEEADVISHICENLSTQTTLRYQLVLPTDHISHKNGEGPSAEKTRFFYTFNGKMYPMKSKLIKNIEDFWEWELYDLEPNTMYAGIGFANSGKQILPSTSIYGITRDEEDFLPTINDVDIKVPTIEPSELPMWTNQIAIEYLGKDLTSVLNDVLAKKHYECKYEDAMLPLDKAKTVYDEFEWIPK